MDLNIEMFSMCDIYTIQIILHLGNLQDTFI